MRKLTLTLVFTLMFSSTSFAEWTKIVGHPSGHTLYVDFERIRKHDGYVYSWYLNDRSTPSASGGLSSKYYIQVDCDLFRFKVLSSLFHEEPMGQGSSEEFNPTNPDWDYAPPTSAYEVILQEVCEYAN